MNKRKCQRRMNKEEKQGRWKQTEERTKRKCQAEM